jgi:hypothetical protein
MDLLEKNTKNGRAHARPPSLSIETQIMILTPVYWFFNFLVPAPTKGLINIYFGTQLFHSYFNQLHFRLQRLPLC